MSTKVKFLTGDVNNISNVAKDAGAILFAINNSNNRGKIYYDVSDDKRIEMCTHVTYATSADKAPKWSTARNFTIYDAAGENKGASVAVDGSKAINLNLPETIIADIVGNVTGDLIGNVTGNVTGNLTGNVTGTVTGSLVGNAATASKWLNARSFVIADEDATNKGLSVNIDGSAAAGYTLHLPGTIKASLTGNASTATKWASAQKVYVKLGTASTTTTIQGGSSSAQTIGVNGVLGGANGGTGQSSWTANRLVYSGTTTSLNNASTIFIDNTHIGVNATTATVNNTAYNLYVNGTTYLKGVLTAETRIEAIGTNDSAYSMDEGASLIVEGGAAIHKQLSAKMIRIDNNTAAKGCIMQFNIDDNCLEFTFQ